MDFTLNRLRTIIDSNGDYHDTAESFNCKVEWDPQTKEAIFYEEMNGEFVITCLQPWDCLPDGTRADFTSENQCVEFYRRNNQHIELEGN